MIISITQRWYLTTPAISLNWRQLQLRHPSWRPTKALKTQVLYLKEVLTWNIITVIYLTWETADFPASKQLHNTLSPAQQQRAGGFNICRYHCKCASYWMHIDDYKLIHSQLCTTAHFPHYTILDVLGRCSICQTQIWVHNKTGFGFSEKARSIANLKQHSD